ncbi:MAG: hypothetical protein P8P83_00545 [Rickettsiaceae bacterium]|nr:hypothetical protein [Rickettsiaceae bacterium]
MKNKPINKSSKTFFTRTSNFLAKTLGNIGYFARRFPGHVFKITGSRVFSFVSVCLMLGASVTTGAIVPFTIGASILAVQTVIKVRQIVKYESYIGKRN